MRFKSEKGRFITLALWSMAVIIVAVVAWGIAKKAFTTYDIVVTSLLTVFVGFELWRWLSTYYIIEDDKLIYRAGINHGSIAISSIRKIECNAEFAVGTNLALATHGFTIFYNRWDELYLSPKNKEAFLKELLKQNDQIEVVNYNEMLQNV